MNGWRGAWSLAKFEWRRERIGMMIMLLFICYLLMIVYSFFNNMNDPDTLKMSWTVDTLHLALLPILGFPMNRTIMRAWRENSFTNRIISLRTLPISVRQIVAGRLIQLMGTLALGQAVYFIALYAISDTLRGELDIGTYIGFVLFWFGYSAGIAGTYTFLEQGFSGKTYTLWSFLYLLLYFGTGYVLYNEKQSVTFGVIRELQHGNWWYTAGSLLFGVILILLVYIFTSMRLKVRSYSR
ncbi:hypothetical protein [Paenibacillus xylaniclasticus]|uniref:hypothetical protein n=1 Tax=Paenibacillus xylaniclasticus TaxID=588083 RepID=UPI000FD93154|nr:MULTISPECIES: hypothetical protein [Paenibacillus]GFN29962.1 hypothetical protein PCURB6_02220 [Paenibacillus curdlanolyticus]